LTLDTDVSEVAAGLSAGVLSPWRMEVAYTRHGAIVVNDAYNANPQSTEAAFRALAALDARRRIAVLGPMLELGDVSTREHRRLGELARSLGISIISLGAPEYGGEGVADIDAVLARLGELGPGDAVLVKASRVGGLEKVAAMLLDPPGGGAVPTS